MNNNVNNNNIINNINNTETDHIDDILQDDRKGADQKFVDELLTNEMLRLSVKDRNAIQEEIHGVKCLAKEETPELVRRSLKELLVEIETKIPDSQKRAYRRSLEIESELEQQEQEQQTANAAESVSESSASEQQQQQEQQSGTPTLSPTLPPFLPLSSPDTKQDPLSASPASTTATTSTSRTYIHGDAFRLRFLRCALFDVPSAAKRLVLFLDMLVELFGEYALRRPIRLSDFTKEEIRHMRKGMIQTLPYRDRSGRRIMICFPEEEQSKIPAYLKAKIAMYDLWAAGKDDEVTQKKGIIVLVWFDASFATMNRSWKIKYKFYTLNCDRISAIHCCSPDTPHYRFRRSIMTMRAGKENLSKLIFHMGESMEIHYKLQGYGIPFEHVPISWTGKVKVTYLKQWMRIRHAIDETNNINNNNNSSGKTTNAKFEIIECPHLQDVVFRQGTSGVSHPGNVTFRSLIESTVLLEQFERDRRETTYQRELQESEEQHHQQQQKQQQEHQYSHYKLHHQTTTSPPMSPASKIAIPKKPKAKRPKQLALDIYEERLRTIGSNSTTTSDTTITGNTNGRFLIWNNEKGWWNELTDKEQICMKIEYMVREFQKLYQKRILLLGKEIKQQQQQMLNKDKKSSSFPTLHNAQSNRKNYPPGGIGGRSVSEGGRRIRLHHLTYDSANSNIHSNSNNNNNIHSNIHCNSNISNSNGNDNHQFIDGGMGLPTKNVIFLQSGTSMFQSQDGENAVFANKRQRLNQFVDHQGNSNSNNGNSESNSIEFGKMKTECFGMKFHDSPCTT